jgi:hypothetical protein
MAETCSWYVIVYYKYSCVIDCYSFDHWSTVVLIYTTGMTLLRTQPSVHQNSPLDPMTSFLDPENRIALHQFKIGFTVSPPTPKSVNSTFPGFPACLRYTNSSLHHTSRHILQPKNKTQLIALLTSNYLFLWTSLTLPLQNLTLLCSHCPIKEPTRDRQRLCDNTKCQGCTNFKKSWSHGKIVGARKVDMKQVPHREPTNIKRHSAKFCRLDDLATGICIPLRNMHYFYNDKCLYSRSLNTPSSVIGSMLGE